MIEQGFQVKNMQNEKFAALKCVSFKIQGCKHKIEASIQQIDDFNLVKSHIYQTK